ncbi:hypothetical protein LR48_Vigan07g274700 [Vigna angularis]|uniref:Uncharacterized protein n=1 Tax=Phaseolus angularis TaxID=3914 RepID=A0A0L9V1Z0_PHAAN|nr:uncharacterized protein HKW66_Vig0220100 [Vigna angularis]KOM49043.1 hypothetical protein LR48_Vigan07g274700 [Vigna angularis]
MKDLQRVTNRTELAVCPPPTSWMDTGRGEEKKVEVDRMPINSVRNPLRIPHEEEHHENSLQKHSQLCNDDSEEGEDVNSDAFRPGRGSYLRCDGAWTQETD